MKILKRTVELEPETFTVSYVLDNQEFLQKIFSLKKFFKLSDF